MSVHSKALLFGLSLLGGAMQAQAQSVTTVTGTGETRTLGVGSQTQTLGTTFLFQGDDIPLSALTVNHAATLDGSHDQTWLQSIDGGYQAKITLQTLGFSADIAGTPAQADPSGALQSLLSEAAAQGYSTIPNGSRLSFVHALNISSLPIMQKSTLQLRDSYTLQAAALGLGTSSSAVGVLRGKASAPSAPAVTVPASKPAAPSTTPKVSPTPKVSGKPAAKPAATPLPVTTPKKK